MASGLSKGTATSIFSKTVTTSVESKSSFVVTPAGEAIVIPKGAIGPSAPRSSGTGMVYDGGSGMNNRTTGVKIMDANKNQGQRVNYMNKTGQTVNPQTGRAISNSDPNGHILLKKY